MYIGGVKPTNKQQNKPNSYEDFNDKYKLAPFQLNMMELKTIYSSNIPVDCYILKNRLESEGLDCFIFDDHMVWIHPFMAVAIGGVKLKVPLDQVEVAERIIDLVSIGKLTDEAGEYEINSIFENEVCRQNEILTIKSQIRNDHSLLDSPGELKTRWLNEEEIGRLVAEERNFLAFSTIKSDFTWDQFWAHLFDFDSSIFRYLRIRPVEFFLDKELVDNYNATVPDESIAICPKCRTENVSYGYAIDYQWDFLYLLWSSLLSSPFPWFRKKYHCFNCGFNFRFKDETHE